MPANKLAATPWVRGCLLYLDIFYIENNQNKIKKQGKNLKIFLKKSF